MKKAIVVGSGAGGATIAKELQGRFEVTVLERGRAFRPLTWSMRLLEGLKKSGLLFDEREIQAAFPALRIWKTEEMVLVAGRGLGGTTTLCTGNALRMDADLRALGIDLDEEFEELQREIPISTAHQRRWRPITRRLFDVCQDMGLNPQPTPKMGHYEQCAHCGRCVLGCPHGVKWDSRQFLRIAADRGARLVTGCRVEAVQIEEGWATGVWSRKGGLRRFYPADLVVLAAGGLATPVILQQSGIACEPHLFVDPVLCVATRLEGCQQQAEVPMPFVVQQERYILSPYFDYLSYLFNRSWRPPAGGILSLMIKLADDNRGSVSRSGMRKVLSAQDRGRLANGVQMCTEILERWGADRKSIFLGTVNAGHPGGMLPLTAAEAEHLHPGRLPENLYLADPTLFPHSLGNPPILTIVALAKRVSNVCARRLGD